MLFVKWPNVAETLCFPYYSGLLVPAQQVKGNPNYDFPSLSTSNPHSSSAGWCTKRSWPGRRPAAEAVGEFPTVEAILLTSLLGLKPGLSYSMPSLCWSTVGLRNPEAAPLDVLLDPIPLRNY